MCDVWTQKEGKWQVWWDTHSLCKDGGRSVGRERRREVRHIAAKHERDGAEEVVTELRDGKHVDSGGGRRFDCAPVGCQTLNTAIPVHLSEGGERVEATLGRGQTRDSEAEPLLLCARL